MRIEEVRAAAFGPLRDRTLTFAPGMTLVWGPNESGKSSWHAALYAGLCGMRRGRGGPRKEERRFTERHRPWAGEAWQVAVVVALADGRRIELSHDLAGLVDCRATDLGLGRDISQELMHDGTPDGARLLGLTRQTLLPTICVRQADLLGILDDPGRLQHALGRAAATAGSDGTAEEALARLDAFRREHLGSERRNSTRPLMRAVQRLDRAQAALDAARAAHAEYRDLAEQRGAAKRAAAAATHRFDRARAAAARRELEAAEERYAEAARLAARFPTGAPPEPDPEEALVGRVAEALSLWDHRPGEPDVPAASVTDDADVAPAVADGRGRSAEEALRAVALLGALAGIVLVTAGQTPAGVVVLTAAALTGLLALRRARAIRDDPNAALRAYARRHRHHAVLRLREVAADVGFEDVDEPGVEPEQLVDHLRRWQAHRVELRRRARDDMEAWHRLQRLTGGADLTDLGARVEELWRRVTALGGVLSAPGRDDEPPSHADSLPDLEARVQEANLELATLSGRLEDRASTMPDVAEAEESLARARTELERLRRLDRTVATAASFLEAARERVHRDIAPQLATSVARRLPAITGQRYEDVTVDPASLEVRVRDGDGLWRDVRLLSHGTAEQIYLLLRIALAEHLVTTTEPAPLLLDDVTVQSDARRTTAILALLHQLSAERQVIVFSQEDEVLAWAESAMGHARDAIVDLSADRVGA